MFIYIIKLISSAFFFQDKKNEEKKIKQKVKSVKLMNFAFFIFKR